MFRVCFAAAVLVATAAFASDSFAQQCNPGQINDPGTYQGSLCNQEQERERYRQQEEANQQMQQRLEEDYAYYAQNASGGGGMGSVSTAVMAKLKANPLLPAAENPLIGRWRQLANAELDLGLAGAIPGTASIVNGAFAGGCESIFGKGMVAFTPTQLNWVAPDGHEEILNRLEYRSDGANIIVIPTDSDLPLIFGLPDHDHVVVGFLGCRMERDGAEVTQLAAVTAAPVTASGSGAAQGILEIRVGEMLDDRFSAVPAGTQVWLTPENPDSNLVKAGFVPDPGGQPIEKLFAACKVAEGGNQADCNRGVQAMLTGALEAVQTDMEGETQFAALPAGRYYLVSFVPYKGKMLMWHLPVDLKAGTNAVTLEPKNGSISR